MLIQTRQEFEAARTVLLDAPYIVCDTETFIIRDGVPTYLMGIAMRAPIVGRPNLHGSFYFPFRHEHQPMLWKEDNLPFNWLKDLAIVGEIAHKNWIFHNAKFDVEVLELDGFKIQGKIWDTMLMSHMSDENKYNHELKTIANKWFPNEGVKDDQDAVKKIATNLGGGRKWTEGWHLVPPSVMGKYAEKDVELTERVFSVLHKDLENQELLPIYPREEKFIHFLRDVEREGVLINQDRTRDLLDECVERIAEIQEDLGFDPGKLDVLAHKLYSPIPQGLGLTPGPVGSPTKQHPLGLPSTAKAVLLSHNHPVSEKVLEYRGYVKARGTWFAGFLEKVGPDGRVHPNYRQHGTVTTRLSCAHPNMQQLPRDSEVDEDEKVIKEKVKEILDAPTGWELWEFDYSQQEFRLAGCYSKEPSIIEAYKNGSDFHDLTSSRLSVTRYKAKTVNFLTIYGGGAMKLAEQLGCTLAEAQEFLDEFWDSYKELKTTVNYATEAARQRGWVRLWTGRRRHFQWPSESHKAFNSIVQGGGAEIVKESCLRIMELPEYKKEIRPCAQVHDSLWFYLPEGRDDLQDIIQKTMEWPTEEFVIPFPVDRKRLA